MPQGTDNVPSIDQSGKNSPTSPSLKRSLTLPLVVLYGLGVTIGAGIYVLVGATAARAGVHAPVAFALAALVMAPSACTFAEFAGRQPVSAGEAAYVREGLRSPLLALLVGSMVVAAGCVSAATITVGGAGYIRVFVDIPDRVVIAAVVLALGGIAAWGIVESVALAALFTLLEIGALLLIIAAGVRARPDVTLMLSDVVPTALNASLWSGILSASLLAFFAFIGFEDLVNIAEEIKEPHKTLPRAIFWTLGLTTLIYVLVVSVAVLLVPLDRLAASKAPLSLVFEHVTGISPAAVSAIAIVATLNGAIVQMIMASRVLYGLSRQGSLPAILGRVSPLTRTPLIATGAVVLIVLILGLGFPLVGLAETSSRITLSIFALVNLALLRIKREGRPAPAGAYVAGAWVPLLGFLSCLGLLLGDFLYR